MPQTLGSCQELISSYPKVLQTTFSFNKITTDGNTKGISKFFFVTEWYKIGFKVV